MTEEIKIEVPDNGKPKEGSAPITDFKIAEIWIRDGHLHLDAVESFFTDRFRAVGLLDACKDIVKQYQPPKEKIIQPKGSMMNFVRNRMRRK